VCKIFILFLTLISCSLASSLAYSQSSDSDIIGETDLGGTELYLTIQGLDEQGTGYILFFMEDETNPQTDDTDEYWVVVVDGAGIALYLHTYGQDSGDHIGSSGIGTPLNDFMNAVGLNSMDSCEFNPLCFG